MNRNSGITTVIIILAIFIVGIAVGGVGYFVGAQNGSAEPVPAASESPTSSPSPTTTDTTSSSGISTSTDPAVIQKELDQTQLNSPTDDINDVQKDASSL